MTDPTHIPRLRNHGELLAWDMYVACATMSIDLDPDDAALFADDLILERRKREPLPVNPKGELS